MSVRVIAGVTAAAAIKALRGKHKAAFETWLDQLKQQGCRAVRYRLSGEDVRHLCVSHLHGKMRVVVSFESATRAAIVTIGVHDRDSPNDVYTLLYAALDTEPSTEERAKPPCCDSNGLPPIWTQAGNAASQVDSLLRRQRRGRR